MLNILSINTLLFTLLVTQQKRPNSLCYKFSRQNLNVYNFIVNPLPFTYYQVLDFSQIVKNIFYIIQNKSNFFKQTVFFLHKNIFYSNSIQKYILDWYERELYEKKISFCFNLFDKRNLLYNYDFRYSYSQTKPNLYFWAFSNIQTQTINFNNNLRVIL